ncbi:hypothetical protein AGMMS49942_18390 [Spirochaetia bacterium]|nr:hypothetical protein AGMMS49942_18390 [Spirochaetia bacterium]
MAIQPIDLQTLFTQVEKVGKEQANQKQGLQLQQSIQGAQEQRKTDERIQSVNESQDTGQGPERIKDRSPRKHREYDGDREDSEESDQRSADSSVIHDPALGKNVDLSG